MAVPPLLHPQVTAQGTLTKRAAALKEVQSLTLAQLVSYEWARF